MTVDDYGSGRPIEIEYVQPSQPASVELSARLLDTVRRHGSPEGDLITSYVGSKKVKVYAEDSARTMT